MIDEKTIRQKLSKYIITRKTHPHLPKTLDGEILLEERKAPDGTLAGVITAPIDSLLNLKVTEKGNQLRAKNNKQKVNKFSELEELTYETLTEADPDDENGWKKYFTKWHKEGLI